MAGKCAKCERQVTKAKLEHMDVADTAMVVKAFAANCPYCGCTMGVFVDPRFAERDLAKIKKALGVS